mgnify:CR=1 FL=1
MYKRQAIISMTLDGIITSWNKSAERMYGYTEAEAVGQSPVSYTHLRAHETVLDLVCRLLLEKKKK